MTFQEKRENVEATLQADRSQADSVIARECDVSHTYVAKVRRQLGLQTTQRTMVRRGKSVVLDTTNLGSKAAEAPAVSVDELMTGKELLGAPAPAPEPPRPDPLPSWPYPWPSDLHPVFAEEVPRIKELQHVIEGAWAKFQALVAEYATSDHMRLASRGDAVPIVNQAFTRIVGLITTELLPSGRCPFCNGDGCRKCHGGGWATADFVDSLATIEDKQRGINRYVR